MKRGIIWFFAGAGMFLTGCGVQTNPPPSPVRVLVLTGGHGFDEAPFYAMFNSFPNIDVTFETLDPQGTFFEDIGRWPYDVIVFYHFRMPITQTGRENLLQLAENGVGMVVLHHALAGFDEWPQWRKIVGAKYFLQDTQEDGTLWRRCTYQHDVMIPVKIHDKRHPVTASVTDFEIVDETYKGYRMEDGNHLLLTTDHPLSQNQIGWTRQYRNARVCSIQLGHGRDAYENHAYRTLLRQAILRVCPERRLR